MIKQVIGDGWRLTWLAGCLIWCVCAMPVCGTASASAAKSMFDSGRAHYVKGDFEEALSIFLNLVKQDKHDSEVYYQIALVYQGMMDFQAARKYFEKTVQLDATHAPAWAHLGEILYREHAYKQAKAALEHALNNGGAAYSHYMQGLVLMELHNYQEALNMLRRAYALQPSYRQRCMYNIGIIYTEQHKRKAAEDALHEAIQLNPDTYIGAMAELALQALHRPAPRAWHVDASYGITYDDNVILKPDENSPQLQGRAQGDFVHSFSFHATRRLVSADRFQLHADASYYKTLNDKITYMNVDVLSGWLTPVYKTPLGILAMDMRADTSWVGGTRYMQAFGVSPRFKFNIGKSQAGSLRTTYQRQHFVDSPGTAAENRDANHFSAGYSHNIYFANRSSLGISYDYHHANSKGANWTSGGHIVSTSLHYPVTQHWSLQLDANYARNQYRNIHSTAKVRRLSRSWGLFPSVSYRFKHVTLQLQYSHNRSKDNVSVYQYHRNTVGINMLYHY